MNKPKNYPQISVVICTFNEEQSLPYVLPKVPEWVDEIILIDGHSTDKTLEIAKNLRPGIKVLLQPGKGKGDALIFGINEARGEIIVTLDADGETPPRKLSILSSRFSMDMVSPRVPDCLKDARLKYPATGDSGIKYWPLPVTYCTVRASATFAAVTMPSGRKNS